MKYWVNIRSKGFAFLHPLENIVVLVRTQSVLSKLLVFSLGALPSSAPPAAVAHRARAGFAAASDLSISANEKGTPFGVPFSLASMSGIDIKHPSYILKNKNEIAQSAMKSAAQMKSKQAWMKLNPPHPSPREAGFHREAISSTKWISSAKGGFS